MYLEKEVQTVAQMVKINGGITTEQYEEFVGILSQYGTDIEVLVYHPETPTEQLIGIAPRGTSYENCTDVSQYVPFARRSDSKKIIIKVKIKVTGHELLSVLDNAGITAFSTDYTIYEVVLSERNQC